MGILDKLFDKHKIVNTLSRELTKPIKQFGTKTSFNRSYYRPNFVHQSDLLYLPEDHNGSKYLLVITDIGSGKTDARALKSRDASTVLKNMKDIYSKKKYLILPKRIHVDGGSEFADAIKYFRNMNIGCRVAATGRHSQQALVEKMNQIIGSAVLKLQLNNELITGAEDTNWVSYLPDILELINKHAKETKLPPPIEDDNGDVKCEGSECDLLEVGSLVRVKLDYPRNVTGNRLHGSFRSGDFRWSLVPKKIENILLFPNQPIRYVVEDYPNNTFAKWELKLFKEPAALKLTNDQYIIEKILKRKKKGNNISFLVRWKGYTASDDSWEPKEELMKTASLLVKEFEESHVKI